MTSFLWRSPLWASMELHYMILWLFMCISPLSITRLLGSKFCSFLYPWNLEVPGMVGVQEGKERDWKRYPNGQAASALPSEWAMWHFHGIKWGVAAACHPKYLFTHLLVAQKLCSKLLIHKRRLLGPAQRYSYSRVRERQVTGTGLAFWAIWSALRISATIWALQRLWRRGRDQEGSGDGEVREALDKALPPGPILLTSWLYLCIFSL